MLNGLIQLPPLISRSLRDLRAEKGKRPRNPHSANSIQPVRILHDGQLAIALGIDQGAHLVGISDLVGIRDVRHDGLDAFC